MKEIMKKLVMKQIGCFTEGQNGWSEHLEICISTEICPQCGDDLLVDDGFLDNGLVEITFSECPACRWKNFKYMEESASRTESLLQRGASI